MSDDGVVLIGLNCVCGSVFELFNLPEHLQREHKKSLPFGCGVCDTHFYSESAYVIHCVESEHNPELETKLKVSLSLTHLMIESWISKGKEADRIELGNGASVYSSRHHPNCRQETRISGVQSPKFSRKNDIWC
jgi:hypothetical protein